MGKRNLPRPQFVLGSSWTYGLKQAYLGQMGNSCTQNIFPAVGYIPKCDKARLSNDEAQVRTLLKALRFLAETGWRSTV